MSVVPNVAIRKRKKQESKPQSQLNKCLNEKRRREQENIYIEELAELISASASDMSSLSVKPDKCAILQETVNQIRRFKREPGQSDELQQSEVSSSKPTILANDIYGPLLLEALDGFLFVVNREGKIEFVSENITSFLRYTQDEIVDKIIYSIIHVNDQNRFKSNLLPMMSLGNGCNWTQEPTSGLSKSRAFNCRFLIKPSNSENSECSSMDNKQPQYENMQVSAVFFPFTRDITEGGDGESENQSRLACVARRIPPNEKSPTSLGIEQFTTRLDVTGKITSFDINGLSDSYSQYLGKELATCSFQDICHSSEVSKILQHLQDVLQSNVSNTVMYKLRVGPDRFVPVQTKSKLFHFNQSTNEQEFIMSTHSIIRENDNSLPTQSESNQTSLPSASSSSASSTIIVTSNSSDAGVLTSLTMPLYASATNLSPSSTELALGDLLNIFPNASWDMDSLRDNESSSPPAPNVVCTITNSSARLPSSNNSSAFSPEVVTIRSASANSSPATPGRAPTPYGRCSGTFSPSPAPVTSGKVSPVFGKLDKVATGATEGLVAEVPTSGAKLDGLANQKLRNLLMQSNESNSVGQKHNNSRDDDVIILSRNNGSGGSNSMFENRPQGSRPVAAVVGIPQASMVSGAASSHAILRELLNQDEEEVMATGSTGAERSGTRLSNLLLNVNLMKPDMDKNKRISDNHMLRRLLNNTDESESKPDDIIQQLLKSDNSERNMSSQVNNPGAMSVDDTMAKSVAASASMAQSGTFSITESLAVKRKTEDNNDYGAKKQNVGSRHAHLAGSNPMLASMLAETPRVPLSLPTSIANTIMTQLPQDRLPKNLEKKLIHTPYTTSTTTPSTTSTTQPFGKHGIQAQNPLMISPTPLQQDVITSDSRGHLLQNPILTKTNYQTLQQGFLNKILSSNADVAALSRSLSLPSTSTQQQQHNMQQHFSIQYQQSVDESTTRGLRDMLNDSLSADANLVANDGLQSNQASDPFFNKILDEIYSLQEEMNVETTNDESSDILKILDDVIGPSTSTVMAPAATTVQDISERIAISAIQKQLMSLETSTPQPVQLQANPVAQPFAALQQANINAAAAAAAAAAARKVVQIPANATAFAQALQMQSNSLQPPAYSNSIAANRVRVPVVTNNQQLLGLTAVQRMRLQQHVGGLAQANVTQIRRSLAERRQKLYLHNEQKRLLEQQQKQQMTMQTQQPIDIINAQGSASFPENINELLNNNVAPPNVTLQRSSNAAEAQLSPRYNTNVVRQIPSPGLGQPATPSQLSPSQRTSNQSPFSPLSQQPYPSPTPPPVVSYQQYQQGGSSHSSSPAPQSGPQSPLLQLSQQQQQQQQQASSTNQWNQRVVAPNVTANNLLQQNPMLNAQLSQQSTFSGNQVKLTAQQRQQLAMRTIQTQAALQAARNSSFQGQVDAPFPGVTPVTATYQNQPQQQQLSLQQQQQIARVQRALSSQGRVTSRPSQVVVTTSSSSNNNFGTNDSLLSPQPLASPSFGQSIPSTSFGTTAVSTGGVTYNISQDGSFFTFDRQNVPVFVQERRLGGNNSASEGIRQELRSIVGCRPQQSDQIQSLSQALSNASSSNVSLNRQALEELGLSIEQLPEVQAFPQSLLNIGSDADSSPSLNLDPNPRVEDPKPADQQKKSLLQQLLSEPT